MTLSFFLDLEMVEDKIIEEDMEEEMEEDMEEGFQNSYWIANNADVRFIAVLSVFQLLYV
jgi:hypothetical protein